MTSPSLLPIVTQLGFSGARFLFESEKFPNLDPVSFHDQIQEHLTARLARLPEELSLTPQHFLCGISQIAIGADSLFTKACASLSIAQRIFLTQGRNEYLDAKSPKGTPDFSEAEKQSALDLLASPHIAFYSQSAIRESQTKAATQVINVLTGKAAPDYQVNR